MRHARRALRILEDLRLVATEYRPHVASRYRLDTRRLEHMAITVRERIAEDRAAKKEAARAELGRDLEGLEDVPGVVAQVLGDELTHRMGWSVRRCNRLHKNVGAPSLEDWRAQWGAVRPHLEEFGEPPGWLWRAGEFLQRVQWARDRDAEAAADRRRLAELAELHPPGELHKFGTLRPWPSDAVTAGPKRAAYLLGQAVPWLKGWQPLRFDGAHLVLAVDNPESLLSWLELLDPAELERAAPGPLALTWTH